MMTVSPARSASGAQSYYLHMREQRTGKAEDYYAKEGVGTWQGQAAAALGLAGQEVKGEDFRQLAEGFAPDGEALVKNAGDPERRAGWDLTFSAPKSVSVAWGLADDVGRATIEKIHQDAVARGFSLIEEKAAFARVGHHGTAAENREEAVHLLAASFPHGTSREQDMQLHSHVFVFNQGLRPDGSWAALESRHFMAWQKAAGAAYRAELAAGLKSAGYAVERDGESFRLASVPHDLERHFSQARERIEAELAARGQSGAKAAEVVNLETRPTKGEVHPDALRAEWDARAASLGHGREVSQPGPPLPEALARQVDAPAPVDTPAAALAVATEKEAVIREQDIYKAAFQACQDGRGMDAGRRLAEQAKAEAVVLQHRDKPEIVRYSTREMVQTETRILATAQARQHETAHQLPAARVEQALAATEAAKGFALSKEQADAVRHLTCESGGVAVMVGDAGTGKSTTLEAVRTAYEAEGYRVLGTAVGGKAAAELAKSAGIESRTVAQLGQDLERGRLELDSKTVLVVDEAGMVDARSMDHLNEACRQTGAKLVLAGDHKQLPPVSAGAPFKHLAEKGAHARLTEIIRQREAWQRTAVQHLSRGEAAKAVMAHLERGQVHVANTYKQAVTTAAQKYVEAARTVGTDKAIATAGTNKQVTDLNREIRQTLKAEGRLADSREVMVATGKLELATGDRVAFMRQTPDKDAKNGDFGTVRGVSEDGKTAVIQLDRTGEHKTVDLKDAHLVHGYAGTAHRLQGATVERAVMLAGSGRELAYVQASRAREQTQMVFTRDQVAKMGRDIAPTERMVKTAEAVAARQGKELPDEARTTFKDCRDYLNKNGVALEGQGGRVSRQLDPKLEPLRDTLNAMSRVSGKESTLDYQERSREAQAEPPDKSLVAHEHNTDRESTTEDHDRQPGAGDHRGHEQDHSLDLS